METSFSLDCTRCDAQYTPDRPLNLCDCGAPLFARYQWSAIPPKSCAPGAAVGLRRYADVLPLPAEKIVTLGEGSTPLLPFDVGLRCLIKDESANPTGTFKARGMAMAVTMCAQYPQIKGLVIPSAGNAAAAAAAYGAAAGLPVTAIMPEETPPAIVAETAQHGATIERVSGTIAQAGKRAAELEAEGFFDLATLKEPYRVEGKKTLGYELFFDLGGRLPDAIIYPTGGGTGLIGMAKAFDEMQSLGWIDHHRPRFYAVQMEGCAPMVRAFEAGAESATPWQDPAPTLAAGLRVPGARGDFLILRALRETGGSAVAVSESELSDAVGRAAREAGVLLCPEGGAALAGAWRLASSGALTDGETIVVFNTGSGLKELC